MFGLTTIKQLHDVEERNQRQEATIKELTRRIGDCDQTIREMADDIRAMDQLIYQMAQCTSWDAMRPYFNQLQGKQEHRQREESNRIGGIMQRELLSVYTKETK